MPSILTHRQLGCDMGLGRRCYSHPPQVWLFAMTGSVLITQTTPTPVTPGTGVILTIFEITAQDQAQFAGEVAQTRATAPPDDPIHTVPTHSDGASFLQLSLTVSDQSQAFPLQERARLVAYSPRCTDISDIQALDGFIRQLTDTPWVGLNKDFQSSPQLHPAAEYAMQVVRQSTTLTPRGHIFTDGSWKEDHGAWTFVVSAECAAHQTTQFVRIGYAGAMVQSEPTPHNGCAADAEATALIAASETSLVVCLIPCHLRYICTSIVQQPALEPWVFINQPHILAMSLLAKKEHACCWLCLRGVLR